MGRNADWSFDKGQAKRIKAEVDAAMHNMPFNPNEIPLHSHDGTLQSFFTKGWHSVSPVEIAKAVFAAKGGQCG